MEDLEKRSLKPPLLVHQPKQKKSTEMEENGSKLLSFCML